MPGPSATFVRASATALAVPLALTYTTFSFAAEPTRTIDCHIRATTQSDLLRLEAMAKGHRTASGTYRFEVFKQSSTGTTQNVQSGEFHLDADRDEILTTVVLDRSAVGHYRAKLTIESQEFGSVSCVSP